MRSSCIILALIASAITLSPALAATYSMDAKGKCRDSSGKFVAASMCAASAHTYKLDTKGVCHDETGKFAKKDLCRA